MALQFQVPNYQQTPLPDIRNALSPISEGIDTYRQGMDAQFKGQMETKRLGMDQRRLQMAEEDQKFQREDRLIKHMGSMAQVIRDDPDQARAAANWQKLLTSVPGLSERVGQYNVDPSNHRAGAQFLAAQAGMYVNPIDEQMKRANLAHIAGSEGRAAAMAPYQLQEAKIGAKLKQLELDSPASKLTIVPEGGTLVRTDPRSGKNETVVHGDPKPLKEHETKDAMWAERLIRTEKVLDTIAGIDPKTGAPLQGAYNPARAANRFAPDSPSFSNLYLANLFNSTNWQRYQQAAREGIAAILRKDTGAAVTDTEWNLYFPMLYPQPGDSPGVMLQKKQSREAASQGLRTASGKAYDRMYPPQQTQPAGAAGADPLGIR